MVSLPANTKVFSVNKKPLLITRSLVPGRSVYGERLLMHDSVSWREWAPAKSKLAAAIMKGIGPVDLDEGDAVLYLGASTGTTVSHISDILGASGIVFGVDSAPRVLRDLVFLAESRQNIAPILADAGQPDTFAGKMCEVDWLYQDVAQKQQALIFLRNVGMFLKPGGQCVLIVKARSVDVTKKPRQVFVAVRKELEEGGLAIESELTLEPYQKDHCIFLCRKS